MATLAQMELTMRVLNMLSAGPTTIKAAAATVKNSYLAYIYKVLLSRHDSSYLMNIDSSGSDVFVVDVPAFGAGEELTLTDNAGLEQCTVFSTTDMGGYWKITMTAPLTNTYTVARSGAVHFTSTPVPASDYAKLVAGLSDISGQSISTVIASYNAVLQDITWIESNV